MPEAGKACTGRWVSGRESGAEGQLAPLEPPGQCTEEIWPGPGPGDDDPSSFSCPHPCPDHSGPVIGGLAPGLGTARAPSTSHGLCQVPLPLAG